MVAIRLFLLASLSSLALAVPFPQNDVPGMNEMGPGNALDAPPIMNPTGTDALKPTGSVMPTPGGDDPLAAEMVKELLKDDGPSSTAALSAGPMPTDPSMPPGAPGPKPDAPDGPKSDSPAGPSLAPGPKPDSPDGPKPDDLPKLDLAPGAKPDDALPPVPKPLNGEPIEPKHADVPLPSGPSGPSGPASTMMATSSSAVLAPTPAKSADVPSDAPPAGPSPTMPIPPKSTMNQNEMESFLPFLLTSTGSIASTTTGITPTSSPIPPPGAPSGPKSTNLPPGQALAPNTPKQDPLDGPSFLGALFTGIMQTAGSSPLPQVENPLDLPSRASLTSDMCAVPPVSLNPDYTPAIVRCYSICCALPDTPYKSSCLERCQSWQEAGMQSMRTMQPAPGPKPLLKFVATPQGILPAWPPTVNAPPPVTSAPPSDLPPPSSFMGDDSANSPPFMPPGASSRFGRRPIANPFRRQPSSGPFARNPFARQRAPMPFF